MPVTHVSLCLNNLKRLMPPYAIEAGVQQQFTTPSCPWVLRRQAQMPQQ